MANARKQMKKTRDDRSYQDEMEAAEEYDDFDPEDFEPLEKAASGGCGPKNKNDKNKNPCENLIGKKGSGNRNGSGNKNCDRKGSGGRKKANGNGNGNGQLSCPKDNADQPKDDCDEIDSQNALCRRSDDNFSDCDCPQANPCKIDWKYSVGFQNFFCQYRKKFGGCQKPCKEMLRSAKNHYRDLCAPDKQDYRCGGTAEPDPCRVPPGTPEQ